MLPVSAGIHRAGRGCKRPDTEKAPDNRCPAPVGAGDLLLVNGPVGDLIDLCPDFVALYGLELVGVGGFLNGQVIPLALVLVVGPDDHIVMQILCRLGQTAEHAVDEGHGLGTGDVIVGTEAAVVAHDPADGGGSVDVILSPVAFDIVKQGVAAVILAAEARGPVPERRRKYFRGLSFILP